MRVFWVYNRTGDSSWRLHEVIAAPNRKAAVRALDAASSRRLRDGMVMVGPALNKTLAPNRTVEV